MIGVTETEYFDDTGTPTNFCPECEHAPCVAGGKHYCTMRPRFIVAGGVRREIFDLLDNRYQDPLYGITRHAVYALSTAARRGFTEAGWLAEDLSVEALEELAHIRAMLRELVS